MGDIIVLLLFVLVFVTAFFFTKKDAMQAFVILLLVSQFLPPYLRFGPIQYQTLFSYISLFLCVLYFINNKTDRAAYGLLKLFLGYFLLLFLWAVLSDTLFNGRQFSYLKTLLRNFSLYLFVFAYIRRTSDVINVYRFFSGFLLVLTVYGLYCYFTRTNVIVSFFNLLYNPDDTALMAHSLQERGGLRGRIQGLSAITLEDAGQLIVSFFMMLHYVLNVKKKITPYYVALFVLMFVNLFFTGSRSGLIGFAAGILVWIYLFGGLSFKVRKRITLTLICGYFTLVFYSSVMADFGDYIRSIIFFWEQSDSIGGSSFEMRLTQLEAAIGLIDNDPITMLFGLGADWVRQYSMSHGGLHPVLLGFESIVFIGLIEFGVIGLFVVTYGFYFMLYRFARKCHASRIATIMIFAFVVFQTFTGNYSQQFLVCFFLVMARECSFEYGFGKRRQLVKNNDGTRYDRQFIRNIHVR